MRKLILVAALVLLAVSPARAFMMHVSGSTTVPPPPQTIASINLSGHTFAQGSPDGTLVGQITVIMSPSSPIYAGLTPVLGGTNASDFRITGSSSPWSLVTNGIQSGSTYSITLTATQMGISNSPFTTSPITINGIVPGVTKFVTSDCTSGMNPAVLSNGGLTVDSGGSGMACRATVPKWRESGKFYFEVTINGLSSGNVSIGVANNGPGYAISPGYTTNLSEWTFHGGDYSQGWTDGTVQGYYQGSATGVNFTVGKTAGFAFDLTIDPRSYWVTPDVTGTGGCGGGPIWNGSVTAAPVFHATGPNAPCGGPWAGPTTAGDTTVTGGQAPVFMYGGAYWPAVQATFGGINFTFNFGASSFIGTMPAGYLSWDDPTGSTEPHPSPFTPQEIQVANAPEWQASHSYVTGDRVVAGPGWTPGSPGSYTSLQPLYLWAVSGAGGTSGGTQPAGFASCTSPAAYGGGFAAGTPNPPAQWSGHTTVDDNGISWVCLTQIDYVSITGASADDPVQYSNGGHFYANQYVMFNGKSYLQLYRPPAGGPVVYCTSDGASPDTDTGSGHCSWETYNGVAGWGPGAVTYRSGRVSWPHEIQPDGSVAELQFDWPVNLHVWYGGKERPQYQGGVAYEADPIETVLHQTHNQCYHDNNTIAWHVLGAGSSLGSRVIETFEAAPGDSFIDTYNNTSGGIPLGLVSNANGVTFYTDTPFSQPFCGNYGNGSQYPPGVAWSINDNGSYVTGLQFWSTSGPPSAGVVGIGSGNSFVYNGNIIQMDSGPWMVYGIADIYVNNIFIYRGIGCNVVGGGSSCGANVSSSPGLAAVAHYPLNFFYNTFVGPGTATCSTCVAISDTSTQYPNYSPGGSPPPVQGNLFIGWASPWGYGLNGNNVGNVGSGYIDNGSGGAGNILHITAAPNADHVMFADPGDIVVNTTGVADFTGLNCPSGIGNAPCTGTGAVGDYQIGGAPVLVGSVGSPVEIWSQRPTTYVYGNVADTTEAAVKALATFPSSLFTPPVTNWDELVNHVTYLLPHTLYGQAASTLVSNPNVTSGLDVRLKPGSAAISASSAVTSQINTSYLAGLAAHDILGNARTTTFSAGATEAVH